MRPMMSKPGRFGKRSALHFVLLFGAVNLFADMTYEGARSVTGPFLNTHGASALVVGGVTGFGEFLGYALRLVSGRMADRSLCTGPSPSSVISCRWHPCLCWPQ